MAKTPQRRAVTRARTEAEALEALDAALVDRFEQQLDGSWAPAVPSPDPPRENREDASPREDV